ncbi:hypothetical protein BM1374166_01900 [Bartonella tribocorum]|nr:hypothetical protein BM1374166_01900 [Bartonella tribocorum]
MALLYLLSVMNRIGEAYSHFFSENACATCRLGWTERLER